MSSASPAAAVCLVGVVGGLLIAFAATTPRRRRPSGSPAPLAPDPNLDFTAQEQASLAAVQQALMPPALVSLLAGVVMSLALALTGIGAEVVPLSSRLVGGAWWAVTVVSVPVLMLIPQLTRLPWDARAAHVRRAAGLLTQAWSGWIADRIRAFLLGSALTTAAALGILGMLRAWPLWWWVPASLAVAAAVVALGLLAPVVIEPIFTRFAPVPDGALRERMMKLAERAGVHVGDVLVADASRRTTALNAYVSGFGPTRRIVLFDTLADGPDVESVVAHELGHARHRDVVRSVIVAAGVAAAAVMAGALVLMAAADPAALTAAPVAVPELVPGALAAAAILGLIGMPLQAMVSRRIEARCDEFALDLTGDPAAFIAMMRSLALANRAALTPSRWRYLLFATHPTPPQRIAMARTWSLARGLTPPPPCVGDG